MSTSTNNTTIRMSVDASGVEAGVNKIKAGASAIGASMSQMERSAAIVEAAMREAVANGVEPNVRAIKRLADATVRTADTIGKSRSEILAQQAAVLGVTGAFSGYVDKLKAVESASGGMRKVDAALSSTAVSARQTAAAMRSVPAQMTDIVTQLAGGQSPLLILTQQGGQLKDMFGGIGPAARALGTYLSALINPLTIGAVAAAGLAYEIYNGASSFNELAKASALTNGYLGLTTGQLSDMAREVAGTSGQITTVQAAMTALVGSGVIAAEQLQLATKVTQEFADDTGVSVEKAAEAMVKFAQDPQKALETLQSQYHTFSAAQVEVIENYIKTGDTASAYLAVVKGMDDAHARMAANGVQQVGVLQKAWQLLKADVIDTINHISQIGVESSNAEKYTEAVERQAKAVRNLKQAQSSPFGNTLSAQQELDAANSQVAALQKVHEQEQKNADDNKKRAQSGDAKIAVNSYLNSTKYANPGQQRSNDMAAENAAFAKATQDLDKNSTDYQSALKRHYDNVATIEKQYASKTKVKAAGEGGINTQLAALQEANKGIEQEEKRSLASLKAQWQTGAIDQESYLQRVHDIQDKALKEEIANAQQRADIAGGKKDKAARERALGDVKNLNAQRIALDQTLTESLDTLAAKRASDVAKYGQQQSDAFHKQQEEQQHAYSTMFLSPVDKANSDAAFNLRQQQEQKLAALKEQYSGPQADQVEFNQKLEQLRIYHDAELAQFQSSLDQQAAVRNSYDDQIKLSMVQIAGTTQTSAEIAGTAFTSVYQNMASALDQFVTTGKMSFSSFASSVIADLAKIALHAAESQIFSAIVSSIGGLSGGGGAGASFAGAFHLAGGGGVSGPGSGTSDSIPAMLSDGEYVVNAASTKKYGSLLEAINSGRMSHFASGGAVGSVAPASASSDGGTPISIQVNNNGGNSLDNQDAADLHKLVQAFVDKRLSQKMRGQGGYGYQMKHGQL